MGAGRRALITTAITVVCAVTVLAAPGTAFASPTPTPSSTPSATASSTPVTNKDLEAVREKLDALYHDAAVATDAYNAAEEQSQKQSAEIVELAKKIVKGQEKLDELKDRAGAAARSQYRTNGLPDEAQLLLSDNPQAFLDGTGRILQGQRATKGLIAELTRTQQDLKQYTADASAQWQQLEKNRQAKAAAKKKVTTQIAAAEKLESQLEKQEKERLAELERQAALKAQTTWLDSGVLKDVDGKASAAGKAAVAYATAAARQAVRVGRRGPVVVRLLGADLAGLGERRRPDPAHLAGAVEAAPARRREGHAPRRPHHLLRRRQPCRDVHRRRRDHPRPATGADGDDRGGGFDADTGRCAPGCVTCPCPACPCA
jgi:septal ring factor EnvC (AmiA/AmiB activator)